jgi:hypothetical protein
MAALVVGCGGGDGGDQGRDPAPSRSRAESPAPGEESPATDRAGPALAVGFTEPNPLLVWSPAARDVVPRFDRWRRRVGRIRPAFYRIMIDWPSLQPTADQPANLALWNPGCYRTIPPCGAYEGVREQLQALASRQRKGGWEGVVVISGSPEWAAGPRAGCERKGTEPRSRAPRPDALPAYVRLVRAILAEARAAGAELRWWSAWNEPNRYLTFSPQRATCVPGSRSVAVDAYSRLVRALKTALDAAPGDQRYVLGDLAGVVRRHVGRTTVREFVGGLPRDLVCGTPVLAQHSYVGSADPVPAAVEALAQHGCRRAHAVWITQTGARVALDAPASVRRRACREQHRSLRRWYRNPAVTAAFQYTVREDNLFPVGLVDTALSRAFPALRLWQAWGGAARAGPEDPPPESPCS